MNDYFISYLNLCSISTKMPPFQYGVLIDLQTQRILIKLLAIVIYAIFYAPDVPCDYSMAS